METVMSNEAIAVLRPGSGYEPFRIRFVWRDRYSSISPQNLPRFALSSAWLRMWGFSEDKKKNKRVMGKKSRIF
jgi:hypothetical protein